MDITNKIIESLRNELGFLIKQKYTQWEKEISKDLCEEDKDYLLEKYYDNDKELDILRNRVIKEQFDELNKKH